MKSIRILPWIIAILTIVAVMVDLPKKTRLNFVFGPLRLERTIHGANIDASFGPWTIKKDLSPRFGLDLAGGTHLLLEANMNSISQTDREAAFNSAKDVVLRRVNLYGLTEPVVWQIKTGGKYRLLVEIPGVSDLPAAVDLIGQTAQLAFYEESSPSGKEATPSSFFDVWKNPTGLTGKNLKKAEVVFNPNTGKPEVSLEFDSDGGKLFEEVTKGSVGKTVAIFLDNQLISAPRVNEPITGGRAVIQGEFTLQEAKRLSIALNAGALPVPLKIIEQKSIGATLGSLSIQKSILAGAVGLLIVGAFMIFNYGVLGMVADIALIIYALLVFALFKLIPVTLTLAGIAGFILSVGMAVDANILIFERMKEEVRWGKDRLTALTLGFNRAFPSIRDSNISSLITCFILYWFGTGMVRGFAITLAVGILVSLFSAITVTRTFLRMVYR